MKRIPLAAYALTMLVVPASAHVGHGGAFTAATGFAHPFSGLDHLAAMLAVGLLSAIGGGARIWAWPAAFVAAMLGSAIGAHGGFQLPMVEPAIAASVLVLGLAVALAARAPVWLGAAVVAAFGVAHGFAHGAEAPAHGFAQYATGFTAATALLHLIGLAGGLAMSRAAGLVPVRILGGATAVLGLVLLVR